MKQNTIIRFFAAVAAFAVLASCNDWTEMETVEQKVTKPWEQNPELWAQYTAALRDYKQSEHFIVYARLHNSPEQAVSEQNYMRCLPDSLDIVALTNADNFSAFDAEDMPVMHEKGTKVLYQVDYAGRKAELTDLAAYLEKVIAAVAANGMDGYSFTADPFDTAATAQIAAKLSAAKKEGQLLVFEGNPLSLAAEDRARVDYVVLDTEKTEHATDVKLQVLNALNYAGIAPEHLLLAAEMNAPLFDEERVEYAAIEEMARRVIEFGPLAGLATYNIGEDYYHSKMNYETISMAIQTLNPSK